MNLPIYQENKPSFEHVPSEDLKFLLNEIQKELSSRNLKKYGELPPTPNNVKRFARNLLKMLHNVKKYQKFWVDIKTDPIHDDQTVYLYTFCKNHNAKGERINCAQIYFPDEETLNACQVDFKNHFEKTYSLEAAEKFVYELLQKYPSSYCEMEVRN